MILVFSLALAGFLLIYFEFFLPGGVMGIVGGLALLASVLLFSYEGYGPSFLFIYIACLAAALGFCISFALKRVKKTGKKGTIFLESDQEGFLASRYKKEMIGKTGEVTSDLKPSGHIIIDDEYYQALSKTGYIEKGTKIEVVGGQGAHLICKQIKGK